MSRDSRPHSPSEDSEYSHLTFSDDEAVTIDRDDVSNYNPENILPQNLATIQKIRKWLAPTQYDIAGGEYRKHLDSHVEGTGSWLTSSDSYQQWLQSEEHGFLWVKGIPGSGKSVHAAKSIQSLSEANPGCPVLYFFFRQIIAANHEPQALVRDWMDQLLEYSPPLQKRLAEYVRDGARLSELTSTTLLEDIKKAFLSLPSKVFCVVDALDEMDIGHEVFFEELAALGTYRPRTVKVFVTSRPVPRVEVPLRKCASLVVRLDEDLVDNDIYTFVRTTLETSDIPKGQWATIAQAVPGKANGLFLYPRLAMDAFCQPGAEVSTVTSQLPADLNMLYTDLIQTHRHRSGVAESIQLLILQAITHAVRPLRLIELANLIMVLDPDGQTSTLSVAKDLIRKACGPLLEILPDETVSVIHHSFTEYLKGVSRTDDTAGYPVLRQGIVHDRLARGCLQYLIESGCLDDDDSTVKGREKRRNASIERRIKFPFYKYAATNWHRHVRSAEAADHPQNDCILLIRRFFSHPNGIKSWLMHNWVWARPGRIGEDDDPQDFTPLHVAAASGLVAYPRALLKEPNANVDVCDSRGRTSLWFAACVGHTSTLKILLEAGANPDRSGFGCGLTPLHMAASANHPRILKILLDAGVDPVPKKSAEDPGRRCGIARDSAGDTATRSACSRGHLEAVDVLLSAIPPHEAQQALWWAVEKGHAKLIRRIAQHPGVDVNYIYSTATALYRACTNNDLASVEALLGAGADPQQSRPPYDGESEDVEPEAIGRFRYSGCFDDVLPGVTPLFGAEASAGQATIVPIFRQLIKAGADVHHRSLGGRTALHYAAGGSVAAAKLLLDAGVSPDVVDNNGSTPLHDSRRPAMVSLLVEYGKATMDMATWKDQTPLSKALEIDIWPGKAERLLELGADPRLVTGLGLGVAGTGALNIVLDRDTGQNPSTALIKLLLDRGADPNQRTLDGRTPLMSKKARDKITQDLLLEAGGDLNAQNYQGETLFFKESAFFTYGSRPKHEQLTRLIDLGATVDVRDHKGRTCLHEVIQQCGYTGPAQNGFNGTLDRIDFLINLNIDPKAVDYAGNSLLHELSRRPSSISTWEHLVYKLKLDMNQVNNAERTPLHTFCEACEPLPSIMRLEDSRQLDFILKHSANIDMPDHMGLTALHLSVARSESLVRRLLKAGADPMALNHDRMNTLHIAARAQKLNIMGLLLTKLDVDLEHGTSRPELPGVNALDGAMNSPLFYAVRSGRPEVVRLLLEAGANPNQGPRASLGFEAEHSFLRTVHLQLEAEQSFLRTAHLEQPDQRDVEGRAIGKDDPFAGLEHHTARLEEILEMLVAYGADFTALCGYTAFCLTQLLSAAEAEKAKDILILYGTRLATVAYWFVPEADSDEFPRFEEGTPNVPLFQQYMRNRQYRLVEELARRGAVFLPERNPDWPPGSKGNLVDLVAHGFTRLVETVGGIVAQKALAEGKWHAFGDSTKPGLWYAQRQTDHVISLLDRDMFPESLMMTAVKRTEPNLAMMKLLVETFGVDPDEASLRALRGANGQASLPAIHRDETPLHFLARGTHWWHVHQGLPYLLSLPGINVNPKIDSSGVTPLHMAVSNEHQIVRAGPGLYKLEAARFLLENGADPNAVVTTSWKAEYSCLALAEHSIEMTRMLLSHGAIVTPESFMAVVRSLSAEALESFLSTGFDPNTVFTPARIFSGESEVLQAQQVSLHLAAGFLPLYNLQGKEVGTLSQRQTVVRLLLERGADPFVRYHVNVGSDRIDKYLHKAEATTASPVPDNYREATALHDIIFCSGLQFLPLFLERGVDLNVKNAYGLTAFHAACLYGNAINEPWSKLIPKRSLGDDGETVFEHLLAAGADITTRDHFDRNILVAMLSRKIRMNEAESCTSAIRTIVEKAPELIDQADMAGETPLMYAIKGGKQAKVGALSHASQLIEAGAFIHCKEKTGDSLLHMLATFMPTAVQKCFRDLVARGLDINERNDLGETPLFNLARRSSKDEQSQRWNKKKGGTEVGAVAMFRELGADFTVKDNEGRGLLHVAAMMNIERFKELLAEGLDPLEEDNIGQTAIDKAAASNNIGVLKLFQKDKAGKK
ncbi:ankyrin [Sarocladium strictum]